MPRSPLRQVRRDLTSQKVLTHRGEEVDHLCVLGKEGFVLDPTGYHDDAFRFDGSLLTTKSESDCAFDHPNELPFG